MSTLIEVSPSAALEWGWSILPCGLNKRPIIDSWKPYQTERATLEQVAEWQRLNPPLWALITGAISDRITLDFDGEGGRRTMERLAIEPHRSTPSGGFHADFLYPGWKVPTLNGKSKRGLGARWPGLDIRADGGYAVFTGRTHRGEYHWLRGPAAYPLDVLPEDLREFLGLTRASEPSPKGNGRESISAQHVETERLVRMALERSSNDGRNNSGFWLACQLRDSGYSEAEAKSVMRAYSGRVSDFNTKGDREAYDEHETNSTLREAFSRPARPPWTPGVLNLATEAAQTLHDKPDLLIQPHTDTGNAERLEALYGSDIRFCPEMKKWLIWDGHRWNLEDTRRIKGLAKRTMRAMYAQAATIQNEKERKTAEAHARKSESAVAINAMLACAEYEEGIPISAREFDRDPYLVNFLNGTLDLKSGIVCPHRREDFITKLVHFNYRPGAECRTFLRFLYRIMGDGPDASDYARSRADRLVSFLQKCFGYALTADVSEKAVFCFFGGGNNGKTTLLETLRFLFAEYSAQVLIENLMVHHSRESNASLADLADLRGARFVTTSEAEEGQRLAVGKLKYLTQGMGEIKTCRKWENPISFKATHKLFIDANHKPIIRGGEKAIWNRLKPIPFTVTIPDEEIDTTLPEQLKTEAEGILAWVVEGCQRWLVEGLGDPPEITEASAEWKAASDQFAAFLRDECVVIAEAWVPVARLWPAYQSWCAMNNEKQTLQKKVFEERLEEAGCRRGKKDDGATRVWNGIGLKVRDDDRQS